MDRRSTRRTLVALTSLALAMPLTAAVVAQEPVVPQSTLAGRTLAIPTTAELLTKGPAFAVETAAEALGLVRGAQRSTTAVSMLEWTGAGTMAESGADGQWRPVPVRRVTVGLDFVLPASRVDVERSNGGARGQRRIEVVAGARAWNEETPGINGTPAEGAADRARLIWLTPHAAMWGALVALKGGQVRLADQGGRLAISYAVNGEPMTMVLGADLLPERVELQARSGAYAGMLLEGRYATYKDFEGYLLPCPTKMTYKAGSRLLLDVTVSDCQVNPYVIFPLPANLAAAGAAR